MQMILYKNEVVPQELLDFLEVKHFHTANKICGFRYVFHLRGNVITMCVDTRQFRTNVNLYIKKRTLKMRTCLYFTVFNKQFRQATFIHPSIHPVLFCVLSCYTYCTMHSAMVFKIQFSENV